MIIVSMFAFADGLAIIGMFYLALKRLNGSFPIEQLVALLVLAASTSLGIWLVLDKDRNATYWAIAGLVLSVVFWLTWIARGRQIKLLCREIFTQEAPRRSDFD